MNSCAYFVGNLGDNPVVVFPQIVLRVCQKALHPTFNHGFSHKNPFSSLASAHSSPQHYLVEQQGQTNYFSAFPQSLLLPLLFVYIRKDT